MPDFREPLYPRNEYYDDDDDGHNFKPVPAILLCIGTVILSVALWKGIIELIGQVAGMVF